MPVDAAMQQKIDIAIMEGNLASLSPAEKLIHYKAVCERLGLTFETHPLDYYTDDESKVRLEINKEGGAQLRKLHGISVDSLNLQIVDSNIAVYTAEGKDKDGRKDFGIGASSLQGLTGTEKSHAIMGAETKAKRRLTISLSGSGMLAEEEVESIKGAKLGAVPAQVAPQAAPAPIVAPAVVAAAPVILAEPAPAQPPPAAEPKQDAQKPQPAQTTTPVAKSGLFAAKPAAAPEATKPAEKTAEIPATSEITPAVATVTAENQTKEPAQNAVAAAAPTMAAPPIPAQQFATGNQPTTVEAQKFMQRATVLARDVLGKAGTKDGGNQIKIYLLRAAGKQNLQGLSKDDWENGLAALEAKVAEGPEAVLQIIKG